MLMKRVLAKVALAGVLASVLVSGSPVRAAMNDDNEGNRLAGSWDIRITQPDYSPLPFGLDFRILRTVTAEGVIDAYAFPGFGPTGPSPFLVSNPGHGSWKRLPGGRRYSVTVKYFQMDQSNFPFVLNSIGTVTEEITVSQDGDSYTSQFVTQIHSPAGDLLFTNTGGTKATRIK